MPKQTPTPTPRALTVRTNLPAGARVVMTPNAMKALVRLFGEEALRRAGMEGRDAGTP